MKFIFFLTLTFLSLMKSSLANPACAVCTIAIGASLGAAKFFGIDYTIVGLWIGALLALTGYWLILYFNKKNWKFIGRDQLLMLLSFSSISFMYIKDLKYTPKAILFFYMDPLLFTTLLGGLSFIYIEKFYQWMKKRNNNHAHFPFEKVVLPVVLLFLLSIYFTYFPISCELK